MQTKFLVFLLLSSVFCLTVVKCEEEPDQLSEEPDHWSEESTDESPDSTPQLAPENLPDDIKQDIFNIYQGLPVQENEPQAAPAQAQVNPKQVTYYLYTRNNTKTYKKINPQKPVLLARKHVNIVFIVHGWLENRRKGWYRDLTKAFLAQKEEYYVVQVDWSGPALAPYYTASSKNTKPVGRMIGELIVSLHKNYSIPLENVLVVGHSLGGQISGFVGKRVQELTGRKLPRLIALDPAGPSFFSKSEKERLSKNDAEVVHVIHTNGGTFGFKESCGTIDFFPNGGSTQPGCLKVNLLDITKVGEPVYCSHQRSWEYFIEALSHPNKFVGVKCKSYNKYKINYCLKDRVSMADLNTKKTGNYYLETNRKKPFGKTNLKALTLKSVVNVVFDEVVE